jgi:anti-anti-sigma regulatory factor
MNSSSGGRVGSVAEESEAIVVERSGDVLVVTLTDRKIVDERGVSSIREAVYRLIESGYTNLVFDLSRVEYLSSGVLGVFLSAKTRMSALAARGSRTAAVPREVVRLNPGGPGRAARSGPLFRSRVFEIYSDRQSAIEAITKVGSGHGWVVLCNVRPALVEVFRVC